MLKVIVLNFLLDVYMWGLLGMSCYHGNVVVHILVQIYTTHYCMERISFIKLPMYIRNTGRHVYATAAPVIIADISDVRNSNYSTF